MRKISVVLAVCAVQAVALAQWTRTDGPYGGSVNSILTFHGQTFAGTWGKMFVSSNRGSSWQVIDALPFIGESAFFVVDSAVVVWIEGAYFRTTDGGASWNRTFEELTQVPVFRAYTFLSKGEEIYAGTEWGIYRSTNGGLNWNPFYDGIGTQSVISLVECQGKLFAGTGSAIFALDDSTSYWNLLENLGINCLLVAESSIFAGTYQGMFRSSDLGGTWDRLDIGISDSVIAATGLHGTDIYVGTYTGIVTRSTDNGSTWMNVSDGLDGGAVRSFTSDDTVLLVGTDNGVYVATDQGTRWVQSNRGMTMNPSISLLTAYDSLFAGTYRGLFILGNGSLEWSQVHSGRLANTAVHSLVSGIGTVFAGTSVGIYRSLDGGQSWSNDLPMNRDIRDLAIRDSEIYAGTDWYVWYSSNGGLTWVHRYGGLHAPYSNAVAIKGSFVFSGSLGDGMNRSTNGGVSWVSCNNGMYPAYVNDILVDGNQILVANDQGGWLSTNDGDQWQPLNLGVSNVPVYSFQLYDQLLFAASDSGISYSRDHGSTWLSWNEGLPDRRVFSVAVMGDYVYAGGYDVWRRPLSELTGVTIETPDLPGNFVLAQNYPNPFNPSTTIRYGLPHVAFVTLTVYNTLGQQVAQLVNEPNQAGYHEATFGGDGLASGVYFFRIQAGDFVATRKLLLLR